MENAERTPAAPEVPAAAGTPPQSPQSLRPPQRAEPSPAAPSVGAEHGSDLPADRVAEIRERIRSGAYDAVDVADEVARRILASGDV